MKDFRGFKAAWVESLIGASIVVLVGIGLGWGGVEWEVHRASQRSPNEAGPYCGCPNKAQCAYDEPEQCGGCCDGKCPGGNPSACGH